MERSDYLISILVTREDGISGIHGLQVEIWEEGVPKDNCLNKSLTSQNGSIELAFTESDVSVPDGKQVNVYLIIRDRDGQSIYNTQEALRPFVPRKPLEFRIALKDYTLAQHYSRPLSWERPEDHLSPQTKMQQIRQAISLLSPPGETRHFALEETIRCLRPTIDLFENILDDAWCVLQGDPMAAVRIRIGNRKYT